MDENWIDEIPVAYDDNLQIKINNVVQKQLLHYVQDKFLNTELQQIIDRIWKEKTYSLA